MAEVLLRKHAGDTYEVHSAGMEPKGINPYTVKVMEEIGLNLEGHRSKDLREYLGHQHFGYFITVCAEAEENCPRSFLMSAGKHFHWFFEDPAAFQGTDAAKLQKFREIRDQIDRRIQEWLVEQRANINSN
jgi:arsenate reductase